MANGDVLYGWPRFIYYDNDKNFLGYVGTDNSVSLMMANDIISKAPSETVYFRMSINGAVRFSISGGYPFRQDKGGFDVDGTISNNDFTHIKTYLPVSDLAGATINWVEDSNNGDTGEEVTYTITNNLTNCVNSNKYSSIVSGSSYTASITASDGYQLNTITVTMGGEDVTSSAVSGSNISITSVTGNIVITATATAAEVGPTDPIEPGDEQWTTTVQTITSTKKYLWSYQVITLTDGTTIETDPCIIGVYGAAGSSGSTGGSSADLSITVNDTNYTATDNVITLPNYIAIPKDKKVTIIGDSITYGYDGTDASLVAKPYPWIIQDLLGIPVYNYGMSGSTIGGGGSSAPVTGSTPMNIRYADMVYADYVLVLGGVNDYTASIVPLGEKGDTTNQTFYGALKILIEGLITKYPTSRIGFMTPLRKQGDTNPNLEGFTLKQYRDAIIDMCQDYSIPVLDLYMVGGCHPEIETWRTQNLPDGLHPNQAYYDKLAIQIARFIQTL